MIGGTLANLSKFRQPDERRVMLNEAAELITRAGNFRLLTNSYLNPAWSAVLEDRPGEAMLLLDLALESVNRVHSPVLTMLICGSLGFAQLFSGEVSNARAAFERQLRLCRGHAFVYGADEGLIGLAAVSALEGNPNEPLDYQSAGGGVG